MALEGAFVRKTSYKRCWPKSKKALWCFFPGKDIRIPDPIWLQRKLLPVERDRTIHGVRWTGKSNIELIIETAGKRKRDHRSGSSCLLRTRWFVLSLSCRRAYFAILLCGPWTHSAASPCLCIVVISDQPLGTYCRSQRVFDFLYSLLRIVIG